MYLFIVNPVSGNGRGHKVWNNVERYLQREAVPYEVHFTAAPEQGNTIVVEQLTTGEGQEQKYAGVVAVGGDGTVHEVVNGLIKSGQNIPFGVIPAGSGNDLARVFHINHWELALKAILGGHAVPMDLGWVNKEHYIINSSGVGFDADVCWHTNNSRFKNWLNRIRIGKMAYVLSLIRQLLTFRKITLTIETESFTRVWKNAWFVAVCNIESYGGGMKICPDAVYDDGKLQVCVVHNVSPLRFLLVFPKVFKGTHKTLSAVELFDAERITIQSDLPVYVHMDGEVKFGAPVEITTLKQAIQVFSPATK